MRACDLYKWDDSIVGYSFPYTNKRIIQEKVYLIAHPTVMMKKDAYVKAGGYQPLLRAEDYFLWNRMRLMGEFYIFKEPLIKYRLLQDSLSHTLDDNFNKKIGEEIRVIFYKTYYFRNWYNWNKWILLSTNLPKN